jgi:LuxR family maltose regulon positive regulatory protein
MRGEMATVLRWLGALPNEVIHTRPMLGLTHAWLLVEVDEFSLAERRLVTTEQAFRSNPTWDADEQAALLGQVALVRETSALMQEYPGEVAIAAGREALALLPESDLARHAYALNIMGCTQYISLGDMQTAERSFEEAIRLSQSAGDRFTELMSRSHVIGLRAIQGRLRAAKMSSDELLSLASQPGWEHLPAAGLSRVWGSPVLYERNDLAVALVALTQGIAEVEGYSLKRPVIIGYIRLARLKLALGEWDECRELMERTWETIQKHHLKQVMIPAAAYRARLFLQINEFETAMKWATTIEPPAEGPLDPALEYDYITLAHVKLASGRVEECQQLLARLQPPAEAAGRMSRVVEILALKSVVSLAQRNEDEALTALKRALVLAEPEGFIRSFVDAGKPMRRLLLEYQKVITKRIGDGVASESLRLLTYTDKLLAAFPQTTPVEKPKSKTIPEPLSERELDILRLIATGRSNQEIAETLVIAVSTVKSHINNLYGKLGTNRRTEAIAIARDMGLLLE